MYGTSSEICVPVSLARNGPALGAQAGERRLREVVVAGGGFGRLGALPRLPSIWCSKRAHRTVADLKSTYRSASWRSLLMTRSVAFRSYILVPSLCFWWKTTRISPMGLRNCLDCTVFMYASLTMVRRQSRTRWRPSQISFYAIWDCPADGRICGSGGLPRRGIASKRSLGGCLRL